MKKFASLIILFTFLTSTSSAEEVIPVDIEGDMSVVRCIEKGNFDFSLFLKSIIYLDGFQEGVVEPWVDVLIRNQCQSADIYNLVKQQDVLQTIIRRNYFTCSTENIPRLRKSFNKLAAEIYYVRHIVDANLARSINSDILEKSIPTNIPKDASNAEKLKNSKIAQSLISDRQKLYSEMYENYVNNDFFEQNEFDNFFVDLESKYSDRKYDYISCEEGAWEEVSEKWDEFINYWSGEGEGTFSEASENFQEGLAARANAVSDEFESIKTIELLNGDISLENYIDSFIGVTINNLDPETFEEVFSEFASEYTESSGTGDNLINSGATQEDLVKALYASDEKFNLEKLEKELQIDFTNQYLTVSDDSLELFLNNLDGRESDVDGLIEILMESFPEMAKVLNGVKCVSDRQCSG